MEYIIILLLSILIILVIYLITKINKNKENNTNVVERLGKLETTLTKDIGDFKYDFSKIITNDFNTLNTNITDNLIKINDKVNKTFTIFDKVFDSILNELIFNIINPIIPAITLVGISNFFKFFTLLLKSNPIKIIKLTKDKAIIIFSHPNHK